MSSTLDDVPEIEITPEMIAAGRKVYWLGNDEQVCDGTLLDQDVEDIYRAMAAVDPSRRASPRRGGRSRSPCFAGFEFTAPHFEVIKRAVDRLSERNPAPTFDDLLDAIAEEEENYQRRDV